MIRRTQYSDPPLDCRSEGYGSLQIWIKYIRNGIFLQEIYTPSDTCASNEWTGSAMVIAGGYVWKDVYDVAFKRNITVVGGGDPVRERTS
jgi:hypothetical protein